MFKMLLSAAGGCLIQSLDIKTHTHSVFVFLSTLATIGGRRMNLRQIFLVMAAVGLTPIALGYGLNPSMSLEYLFEFPVPNVNGTHIFRAIMGLYLALAVFWVMGAYKVHLRQAALYSLVVFMFGLAAGRVLSLVVDGVPHWLLLVYLALELGFGIVGMKLLKRSE
jgi:hypothetical protein